jgi:hypothetical protein
MSQPPSVKAVTGTGNQDTYVETAARLLNDWLTYREVALILMVDVKTIRNRMCVHQLPRILVKVGRGHRRYARVPPETVRELARLIGTAPYLLRVAAAAAGSSLTDVPYATRPKRFQFHEETKP